MATEMCRGSSSIIGPTAVKQPESVCLTVRRISYLSVAVLVNDVPSRIALFISIYAGEFVPPSHRATTLFVTHGSSWRRTQNKQNEIPKPKEKKTESVSNRNISNVSLCECESVQWRSLFSIIFNIHR